MRYRNIYILLGIILILLSPLTAVAGGDTGMYLGAGVGRMDVNDKVSNGED